MRTNISLPLSIIILSAVIIVCTGAIVFFAYPEGQGQYSISGIPIVASAAIVDVASTTSSTILAGVPVRLIIPAINVDTAIAPAGLTADGAMAVPVGPTSTTWFDLGARPGESGSAVIAGHEGWKDGIFAIFDNLHELKPGDKIYIVDDQGASTTFVVQTLALYDQYASAASVFNSSDGKAHLNLITCEGTWNATLKSYSNRLVVFADEVE